MQPVLNGHPVLSQEGPLNTSSTVHVCTTEHNDIAILIYLDYKDSCQMTTKSRKVRFLRLSVN